MREGTVSYFFRYFFRPGLSKTSSFAFCEKIFQTKFSRWFFQTRAWAWAMCSAVCHPAAEQFGIWNAVDKGEEWWCSRLLTIYCCRWNNTNRPAIFRLKPAVKRNFVGHSSKSYQFQVGFPHSIEIVWYLEIVTMKLPFIKITQTIFSRMQREFKQPRIENYE